VVPISSTCGRTGCPTSWVTTSDHGNSRARAFAPGLIQPIRHRGNCLVLAMGPGQSAGRGPVLRPSAACSSTFPPPDALPGIPGLRIIRLKARRLRGPTRLATGSDLSEPSELRRAAFVSFPGNRGPSLILVVGQLGREVARGGGQDGGLSSFTCDWPRLPMPDEANSVVHHMPGNAAGRLGAGPTVKRFRCGHNRCTSGDISLGREFVSFCPSAWAWSVSWTSRDSVKTVETNGGSRTGGIGARSWLTPRLAVSLGGDG
jgi:hypothetical protein